MSVETGVAVPMRDGTVLRAIVRRPASPGRHPVLVMRTPYGAARAAELHPLARRGPARGYAVVIQDVRGRHASDGEFDPYRQEGRDGRDTIEWAAEQPWSSGAVGTFGLSYPGAAQWLAAVEAPPSLRAMIPAMTYARPDHFWYAGGLPDLSWVSWIWLHIAPETRRRRGLPGPRTYEEAVASWPTERARLLAGIPDRIAPDLAEIAPWFVEWMRHPPHDPWWAWADLRGRYRQVRAAVLNVSGWYDDYYGPEGAVTNHLGLVAARSGETDPRSSLLLGPWIHGFSRIGEPNGSIRAGERSFGPAARMDVETESLRFMDRHLRDDDAAARPAPVRAFVMGRNRWWRGQSWPPASAVARSLYLGPGDIAGGTLTSFPPDQPARLTLTHDPARPLHDRHDAAPGAHDYRDLGGGVDSLAFDSPPLAEPLDVLGQVQAEVWVAADAPTLDVWVRVLDVAPDGTAWNLASPGGDVVRIDLEGRPRGVPVRARVDGILTGNRFDVGHRVRVVVMASFLPHFAPARTGARGGEARPIGMDVVLGVDTPSRIVLPVLRAAGSRSRGGAGAGRLSRDRADARPTPWPARERSRSPRG
ncbi:MAG: CocE/NonD family hydrolase [Ectothiorhodospiraceae bacterium]|nr:CocE/NonD family hydrolase [Ectothiorhodospiraceae bacterium]